jgi:hypothetical protein
MKNTAYLRQVFSIAPPEPVSATEIKESLAGVVPIAGQRAERMGV